MKKAELNENPSTANNAIEAPAYHCDEMNFAEFPIASMADSLPADQKSLSFSVTIFDRVLQKDVVRKLTIMAPEKYGLPLAKDDEVSFGLIQLTAKQKFASRRVYFSRRELLNEIGWRDESKYYARVWESLKRWKGAVLEYENAWRSAGVDSYVSRCFNILDDVMILHGDAIEAEKRARPDDPNAGKCWFTWSEPVFESFVQGNVKQIDAALYRRLKSGIAKRLYRFLDKRLYKWATEEFKLESLAFERIGLSRKCHTGEIKRLLRPAILELEDNGYLKPLPDSERFIKEARGLWKVTFTRTQRRKTDISTPCDDTVQALIERGVGQNVANNLVQQFSKEFILARVRFLDWLCARNDKRVSKNRPGFLVSSILREFPLPSDFEKTQIVAAPSQSNMPARQVSTRINQQILKEQREADFCQRRDKYLNALSLEAQKQLEEDALKACNTFLREQYSQTKERGGQLFEAAKRTIIDQEIRRRFEEENSLAE